MSRICLLHFVQRFTSPLNIWGLESIPHLVKSILLTTLYCFKTALGLSYRLPSVTEQNWHVHTTGRYPLPPSKLIENVCGRMSHSCFIPSSIHERSLLRTLCGLRWAKLWTSLHSVVLLFHHVIYIFIGVVYKYIWTIYRYYTFIGVTIIY